MATRNPGWHNHNSTRDYPFDGSASLLDNAGTRLPSDILAGLKLMVPEDIGRYVYVGGITVTANVCTVVLLAAQDLDGTGALAIASLTVTQPATRYISYEVSPMTPGVLGWLTLGPGITNQVGYSGRFTSPRQSLLAPRAARWYKRPPLTGAGKLGNPALTGLVSLIGGTDIEIVKACREVPGAAVPENHPQYCGDDELGTQVRDVIVFRLKDKSIDQDQNVFDIYKGQCGKRPESRNCGDPDPIEFLGPVQPDCCGNITLVFSGCADISKIVEEATVDEMGDVIATEEACGIVVDCGLGLSEACITKDRLPDEDGRLPNEYEDLCVSVSVVSESTPTDPVVPDPIFDFDSVSADVNQDPALPVTDNFQTFGNYVNRHGVFRYRENPVSNDVVLTADSGALRNVVTYEPTPALNNTFYKRAKAVVTLRSGTDVGSLHNAAVLANYRETEANSGRHSYYAAEIDWDGHYRGFKLFRIAKYTGFDWVTVFSVAVPQLQRNVDYLLSLEIYPQAEDANNAWLIARLRTVVGGAIDVTIGPLAVNDYAPATGLFGMGTYRSLSRFRQFAVENITSSP